jgi:putative transposase
VPRMLVPDKLASYGVAHRRLMPSVEHRRSKYLNNRAENFHQLIRQRERAMKKFISPGGAQRDITLLSAPSPPTHRSPVPTRDGHPIHHLEPGHRTRPRQPPNHSATAIPSQDCPETLINKQLDSFVPRKGQLR